MQFALTIASVAFLAVAGVSAAPTKTYCDASPPPAPVTDTKGPAQTHRVAVGRGGLTFSPDNIVAEIGDVIEFNFFPKNHAVVRSSFEKPCEPIENDSLFMSGYNFATNEGEAPNVYQIVVKDKKPIWFYCPQADGDHCRKGMTGVINQNVDDPAFSLAKHRELAAKSPKVTLPNIQLYGEIIPNPHPNDGV